MLQICQHVGRIPDGSLDVLTIHISAGYHPAALRLELGESAPVLDHRERQDLGLYVEVKEFVTLNEEMILDSLVLLYRICTVLHLLICPLCDLHELLKGELLQLRLYPLLLRLPPVEGLFEVSLDIFPRIIALP